MFLLSKKKAKQHSASQHDNLKLYVIVEYGFVTLWLDGVMMLLWAPSLYKYAGKQPNF